MKTIIQEPVVDLGSARFYQVTLCAIIEKFVPVISIWQARIYDIGNRWYEK